MPGPPPTPMVGKRFGKLLVLADAGPSVRGHVYECRCDCGATAIRNGRDLRKGGVKSCGCYRRVASGVRIRARPPRLRHGHAKAGSGSYRTWKAMIQRCTNPASRDWIYYGGRGITVCEEWRSSFEAFLFAMGDRPAGLTLDRIDPDAGYEPANCRWATRTEQNRNRRQATREETR